MRFLGLESGIGDSDLAETEFETPRADVACEAGKIGRSGAGR
jgi:hypothetical protein